MDETKAKLESRMGSFLPEIVPIRKPWRRNKELERHIINRQMRECEQLAHYLDGLAHVSIKDDVSAAPSDSAHLNNGKKAFSFHMDALLELYVQRFESVWSLIPFIAHQVQDLNVIRNFQDKWERMEAFVAYLLCILQQRGDIIRFGWYKMYENGRLIDDLGVDQWCWLAERHGGRFCPINTKSSAKRLEHEEKRKRGKIGWRRIVFLFCPHVDPCRKLSEEDIADAADQLLKGLIRHFGNKRKKKWKRKYRVDKI